MVLSVLQVEGNRHILEYVDHAYHFTVLGRTRLRVVVPHPLPVLIIALVCGVLFTSGGILDVIELYQTFIVVDKGLYRVLGFAPGHIVASI